ncbi:contact-dependent growth inhibition system immunity protein [uncultured Lutibacter sp.]|uniref:contact-dependent growth inhibition system immunity protein n=1 Tax=uncultured Lutibacter sp. TaxID=437739 RepID=UPI0026170598|nr:contact-dependent growth inhibition system immunity protein [uncultured Lutibacter sp.]
MKENLSIEQLEKDYWKDYDFETDLVKNCYDLRKVPIKNLKPENIRLLIGQNIGVNYILRITFNILEKNPLIDSEFYEGDLLVTLIDYFTKYPNRNQELKLFKILLDFPENFDDRKVNSKVNSFLKKFNSFGENLSNIVFTSRFVIEDNKEITLVSQDKEDGAWQFLSSDKIENFENDARLVSLREILKLDESILEIGNVEIGQIAQRKNKKDKWKLN